MAQSDDFFVAICGGGMAGLSAAFYLAPHLSKDQKILIIDPETKDQNDRTWCFWEEQSGPFENIVYKKWLNADVVFSKGQVKKLDMGSYTYKMIRGIDFYQFVLGELSKYQNVTFLKDHVLSIDQNQESGLVVKTASQNINAKWVLDSAFRPSFENPTEINLKQHFGGWLVEADQPVFDPKNATLMNFSISPEDDCQFMYTLPTSSTSALVEFTLFNETLLAPSDYDAAIHQYLVRQFPQTNFKITEKETGWIPMSTAKMLDPVSPFHVKIGTAGGSTNPSTGYTFTNTQRDIKYLIDSVLKDVSPRKKSLWQQRFDLYAGILLQVLKDKKIPPVAVFENLYSQNPAHQLFSFLDGTSSFKTDLGIMWRTPRGIFEIAALKQIWRRITNQFKSF